jgi:hypothetical protein
LTKARDLANASTALSAVSATELAFVDGVTSAIQTQMDAKAPSSTAVTLTGTQTLTNKTLTNPVISSVINNTLTTTTGDIIYASAANTPARLGIGSTNQVLKVSGGIPAWGAAPSSSFVGASAYRTTSQAIPEATWTAVTWPSEYFDQGGIHASSSSDFVCNATGYWLVTGSIMWDVASGGFGQIYVEKNNGSDNQIFGRDRKSVV